MPNILVQHAVSLGDGKLSLGPLSDRFKQSAASFEGMFFNGDACAFWTI